MLSNANRVTPIQGSDNDLSPSTIQKSLDRCLMKYISARFRLSLDINVPLRSEIVAIYFMPATNLESVLEIISQQDETLTFWLFFQRAWSVAGCHLVLLGVESSLFSAICQTRTRVDYATRFSGRSSATCVGRAPPECDPREHSHL